ncbi:MAG: M55 family metallopeptidase [Clostridia bacterium]|nr:M55 family metallopeptidase [Clostridia bacterium]
MNVLILTDLEGISGVSSITDIFETETPGYKNALVRLMADTNTAVRAAFDEGAETVYVVDGHGGGKNFIEGALDPRAVQISVSGNPEVIRNCDAVVAIGMHAMAGTQRAFLDHTQSSKTIHHYRYNGERIGELSQIGVYAGHFDVPCVAVSGDVAACAEARALFGENVAIAVVKEANVRNTAICVDNVTADQRIYDAVAEGIRKRDTVKPLVPTLPLEIAVEYNTTALCDDICRVKPYVERVDGYTVRALKEKIETYYDVLL